MPLSSNPVKDTRFSTSELGFKSLWGHFKIYIKKYISKSIKFYYFTQRKFYLKTMKLMHTYLWVRTPSFIVNGIDTKC